MLCVNHRYKGVRREDPNPIAHLSDLHCHENSTTDSLRFVSVTLESKVSATDRGCTIARVLLAYLFVSLGCLTSVGAVNLRQCGARLKDLQEGAWNATNSTSSPPPLHLSYGECIAECGGGTGDVNWDSFSQSFGAWFLPWIALMFQIPFGAECT